MFRIGKSLIVTFLVILLYTTPVLAATAIPFTINLSEPVNVTGTPRIAVDVGGVTRYATYSSGTTTSALTFTYNMVAGDVDLDGVTVSSPIDLNGGTIKDLAGNDLTPLTFTAPNTTNVKVNYPSLSMDFIYDADGRYTLNGTAYNDLTSFLSAASGSFTRASVGTYYDSAGTLQTAASGVPRFDFDPVTHAAKGILIEESRANLWQDSEAFNNPFWIASQVTVSPNVTISPAGTMTAEKITEASGGTFHYVGLAPNYSANTTRTVSVYAKAAERQWLRVYADDGSVNSAYANFNLGTGTYDFVGGNNSYTSSAMILNVGNGWYRCILTYSIATSTTRVQFIMRTTGGTGPSSYAGDGSSGLYLWGAQIEQGAFATSYIPTTTATVTRAADVMLINNISPWSNTNKSTLFSIFSSFGTTVNRQIASFGDGISPYYNGAQRIGLNSSNGLEARQQTTSGQSLTGNYSGPSATIVKKISFASDVSGTGAVAVDGTIQSLSQTGIAGTISFSKLGVGNDDMGTTQLNGYVEKFKYYPSILSNTQLQLLTQ